MLGATRNLLLSYDVSFCMVLLIFKFIFLLTGDFALIAFQVLIE